MQVYYSDHHFEHNPPFEIFDGGEKVPNFEVPERAERRDVDDAGPLVEPACQPLPEEGVDRVQEGRQRLAGAGGRRHEHVAAGRDLPPGGGLRLGRIAEAAREPGGDHRVEGVEHGPGSNAVRWREPPGVPAVAGDAWVPKRMLIPSGGNVVVERASQ